MRFSGRVLLACLALVVLVPAAASANGFYMPSVGSRASAMGGAFVGLADDYSAVHWNPAGIVGIQGTEATFSVADALLLGSRDGYVAYFDPIETPNNYAIQSVRATTVTEQHIAPGFFLYTDAGPLKGIFSKVGICGYTIAEYGAAWDAEDVADGFVSHPYNFNEINRLGALPEYATSVRAYVLSPVVAKKLSDRLSIGITGHYLYASMEFRNGGWISTGEVVENPPAPVEYHLDLNSYQVNEDVTGTGYGATFGVLLEATDQISVGATVRTPMTVTFEGDIEVVSTLEDHSSASQTEQFDFTFPLWAGVGVAYHDFLFEGTVLTIDGQWTQWSAVDEIVRSVDTELPNGLGTSTLDWEDTLEVGVGLDYRVSRSVSVRLGYRSMPTPVPDETFDFVAPMSEKSAFSFGVGYRSDVWTLDLALAYQAGEKRNLEGTGNMDGKHLDDIMIPSLSFTYGF